MVVKALEPAAEFNPLYRWFLIVVLGIYVPGRFTLCFRDLCPVLIIC